MALVNYDNSDISDDEEENYELSTNVKNSVISRNIVQSSNSGPTKLFEKYDNIKLESSQFANEEPVKSNSLLLGLPVPKLTTANQELTEDDLEDIVKPKDAELALREKPPPLISQQRIKIVIPSLPANDSDEEEGPATKKIKQSTGHGLFDLLPAPKSGVTSKSLVPQSVSKKAKEEPLARGVSSVVPSHSVPSTSASKSVHVGPLTPQFGNEEESDDSDNDAGENFFSLTSHRTANKVPSHLQPHTTSLGNNEELGFGDSSSGSSKGMSDAPLQFRTMGPTISWSKRSEMIQEEEEEEKEEEEDNGDSIYETNDANYIAGEYASGSNRVDAEQLLRLQGKKNWGREAMNIIDVHADEYLDPMNVVKNLTEETSTVSHSKKNKEQLPSVQKRKHQITWLAYKAKEQELELKQQWAENKQTKKQTQSKYGF